MGQMASLPLSSSSNPKRDFVYDALLQDNHIRLLRLAPAKEHHAPLSGSLMHADLKTDPEYDALSYVWGDPAQVGTITVDGKPLPISQNLRTALRYVRQRDRPYILWTDAICINQADEDEKYRQVRLMRQIYAKATCVRAWIDHKMDRPAPALKMLAGLEGNPSRMMDYGERYWYPAANLFKNKYWSRLWVQQEVMLAQKFIIQCQDDIFDGQPFLSFARIVLERSADHTLPPNNTFKALYDYMSATNRGWEFVARNQLFFQKQRLQPAAVVKKQTQGCLLDLFMSSRYLQVSDQRDRVFGLLGISNDGDSYSRRFDGREYSTSVTVVYINAINSFVNVHWRLSFLCLKGWTEVDKDAHAYLNRMPSWLPTPFQPSHFRQFAYLDLAGGGEINNVGWSVSSSEPGLHCSGVMVGRVQVLGSHGNLAASPIEDWYAEMRRLH